MLWFVNRTWGIRRGRTTEHGKHNNKRRRKERRQIKVEGKAR